MKTMLTTAAIATALALPSVAPAAVLKTLYSFCSMPSCADGNRPIAGLVSDAAGNLYGTTIYGGNGHGVAFMLTPGDEYKVSHTFCSKTNCVDGNFAFTGLIVDTAGNLYGTAANGGAFNAGLVYELSPNADKSKFKLLNLYSFCSQPSCTDGEIPRASLSYQGQQTGAAYDGTSTLYGAAEEGGLGTYYGVAFELTFVPGKTKRKEKVLYDFCSQANCSDGGGPNGLVIDSNGNLFGTAGGGGSGNGGVVYELSPKKRHYRETVLYNFCYLANCADGKDPVAPPVMDAQGNLFGTTNVGGPFGPGVVFEVIPNGVNSQENVLYAFCPQLNNCLDGSAPESAVTLDSSGNIFGTTTSGGAHGGGTIFKIASGTHVVLYDFCAQANCTDGQTPFDSLILDSSGNLYGTTASGGAFGDGTIFELIP